MEKINLTNHALFNTSQHTLVQGRWSLIQFIPNPSTHEVFNIGVIFKENRKPILAKTLNSTSNFEIMYGKDGVENFSFLIKVLQEMLVFQKTLSLLDLKLPSAQLRLTKPRSAQGVSSKFILESLYKRMVPLGWNDINKRKEKTYSINSKDLRDKVIGSIKKLSPDIADIYLHKNPTIFNFEHRKIEVDLPFFKTQGQFDRNNIISFASIVSMRQKSDVHRQLDSLKAGADLAIVKEIHKQSDGKLMLLNAGNHFDRDEALEIDNEIDNVIWRLGKSGIAGEAYNTEEEIVNSLLKFAA